MSSSNEPPGGPAGPGKRRPPTIDLNATEVASEPAGGAQAAPGAEASSSSTSRPWRQHPALAWLPADIPWPLVAAGAGGAALMLAVLALAGVFSGRESGSSAEADARLNRMEQQIRNLTARPIPVAADTTAVEDLAGRLARLETVAATPRPPISDPALANRLATLEGELKALGERVGVLGRRNDEIASIAGEARSRADAAAAAVAEWKKAQTPATPVVERKEIEALSTRIAALERAAKAMEAQLAGRSGDGADRSLRLVVVASTLNAAVDRGAPFAAELAAAKAAAPDPKLLAALEPFASSGVPTAATLTRELTALMPAVAKAVGTSSRGGGILDRLKASAERVVSIRPIDETPGDEPAAIVRRIEIRAEQGNLNGAMAEMAKLPEGARALTREWVARAQARNAAVEASRRFAADALASIGKPSL
jgi:hypothetical protein